MSYQTLKDNFQKAIARREFHISEVKKYKTSITFLEQEFIAAKTAQLYLQKKAEETQQNLEYRISNLVSTALSAVFDDPDKFRVKFVQRRGKTECDLMFIKNDQETEFVGGGVRDITCFALKITFLLMSKNKKNNRLVFITDEPFRNLHGKKEQENCSDMAKMLSKECNLQILMISDVEEVNKAADKIFHVEMIDKISYVN
jgi:DNA repair exonuclease SbcCD ATPase subunit